MTLTASDAVPYGLLVMYAEDMFDPSAKNTLTPPLNDRIEKSGWTVRAMLTADDSLAPRQKYGELGQAFVGKRVFYGFVAQSKQDSSSYVAVIRGTAGMVEWMLDAEFVPIEHPKYPAAHVEQGFWRIFDSMQLAGLDGQMTNPRATAGVAQLVGEAGKVVVVGHSLGSALATYFAQELAEHIGERASACMFASPHTGDAAWVKQFDDAVAAYRLFNYVIDVVPHVPMGLGYTHLPRVTPIEPAIAEAGIKVGLRCNHHVLCYCAMLDFQKTQAARSDAHDRSCASCILGAENTVTTEAKLLAGAVRLFGAFGDNAAQRLISELPREDSLNEHH